MAEQVHPSLTLLSTMQTVAYSCISMPLLDSSAVESYSLEGKIPLLRLVIQWTSQGLAVAKRTVLI